MTPVSIALLQSAATESGLAETCTAIRKAADQGAQIICTQELFASPYFCQKQDTDAFDLAEPIPGPTSETLCTVAKEKEVVVIASLFEKRAPGLYHNTAVVIDADGTLAGIYRKSHIPQDPCFEEKFYFTPGDTGFRAFTTRYAKIGVLICWDQWFPESARLTALDGAEIIFCPTAIGWLAEEKETEGKSQLHAWQCVQQGQAVANGCYYAAINRTGKEDAIEFWGHSFVADYYGQKIIEAGESPKTVFATCDLAALERHRRIWPFFRDRRIDCYGGLLERFRS